MKRSAMGFTLIELMIVITVVALLTAIAIPNFRVAKSRPGTRSCYANQKTIAGAVEMYNLDKNTKRTDLGVQFFRELKASGYLHSPADLRRRKPATRLSRRSRAGSFASSST